MMSTTDCAIIPMVVEACAAGETTELIRGSEEHFVGRLSLLVSRQSILLDLKSVTRIDAAGLAALLSLYKRAREAGHSFTVFNPTRRVAEILALFRLDRILLSRHGAIPPHIRPQFECSAA
jgi:ABC-type transporter Mla MlaB component